MNEDKLRAICTHAGVKIVLDPSIPTAAACVADTDYVIRLGKLYMDSNSGYDRAVILAHELAHILRGDLLRIQKEKLDMMRWNIAADVCINAGLDHDAVNRLGGVTHEKLKAEIPGIPDVWHGARPIYDAFPEADSMSISPQDSLETDGSMDGAKHAATVLKARLGCTDEEAKKMLDGLISGITPGRSQSRDRRSLSDLAPVADAKLLAAIRKIKSRCRGALAVARSWMRAGRVEGLRGQVRTPRRRIMLAVDMSGSMDCCPLPHQIALWLSRQPGVEPTFVLWADRAQVVPSLKCGADVGGGTQIESIRTVLTGKWDAVVIATDGQVDKSEAKKLERDFPVIWVKP